MASFLASIKTSKDTVIMQYVVVDGRDNFKNSVSPTFVTI